MIVDVIAGARPNFMKVAALFEAAPAFPTLTLRLIHTGQHYDANMSDVFLQELNLPEPTHHLRVGSGDHTTQTTLIMQRYDAWIVENPPKWVLVVGDVNSTLACALVAAKRNIPVGHVEAGLRSFDRTMPEEINRIVTDSISSLLFATENSGVINLAKEGHPAERIHLVGHVMIDTLLRQYEQAKSLRYYETFGFVAHEYGFVTLHRPSNVDDHQQLRAIVEQLEWTAERLPLLFAVHPRTQQRLTAFDLLTRLEHSPRITLSAPLSYRQSLSVMANARVVITDSGGIQEETSVLGVPCLTLRDTTERPITLTEGTNTLIKNDWTLYRQRIMEVLDLKASRQSAAIPYWDGKAAQRILRILVQHTPHEA